MLLSKTRMQCRHLLDFALPSYCRAQGVQFMRRLVWEVLRLHHLNTISIKPRVQRHLPVSWWGAGLELGAHHHMQHVHVHRLKV